MGALQSKPVKGDTGPAGPKGDSISNIALEDGQFVITTSAGNRVTTSAAALKGPKGDPFETITNISVVGTTMNVVTSQGKTLTVDVSSLKGVPGVQGLKGDRGEPGASVKEITINNGVLTIVTTDGRTITGNAGGPKGDTGVGISNLSFDTNGVLTIQTTDGKTWSSSTNWAGGTLKTATLWCADGSICNLPADKYMNPFTMATQTDAGITFRGFKDNNVGSFNNQHIHYIRRAHADGRLMHTFEGDADSVRIATFKADGSFDKHPFKVFNNGNVEINSGVAMNVGNEQGLRFRHAVNPDWTTHMLQRVDGTGKLRWALEGDNGELRMAPMNAEGKWNGNHPFKIGVNQEGFNNQYIALDVPKIWFSHGWNLNFEAGHVELRKHGDMVMNVNEQGALTLRGDWKLVPDPGNWGVMRLQRGGQRLALFDAVGGDVLQVYPGRNGQLPYWFIGANGNGGRWSADSKEQFYVRKDPNNNNRNELVAFGIPQLWI